MLTYLFGIYKNKSELIRYFLLTYLDRGLTFILPLSILFIIKDKSLYNTVEVIFSYAALALALAEMGFSNYLFWGYKQSDDKEKFVCAAKSYFSFALTAYLFLSILLTVVFFLRKEQSYVLVAFVCIRTLFTLFNSFYSNYFRLKDEPTRIYYITIPVSIFSFGLLMMAYTLGWSPLVLYFFLPSFAVLTGSAGLYVVKGIQSLDFNEFCDFLKKALLFSWPIILNTLFMSFMNNYAKIYAYGNLTQDEMSQISYVLRVGMLIQLAHAAFSSYYSKALYMDVERKLNVQVFRNYSIVIIASTALVFALMIGSNAFLYSYVKLPTDGSIFLFAFYILLWCYIGYLEIYFGIANANRKMLFYSVISSVFYITLLRIIGASSPFQLGVCMVATTLFNLLLVIFGLSQLGVISLGTRRNKLT